RGFSAAVNQGIFHSTGEYIVFLNPDVVVFPSWLERLCAHFVSGKIGAVGPLSDYVAGLQKVQLYIRERISFRALEDVDRFVSVHNHQSAVETKLLIGFCLMTRKKVLDEIGLLDEKLFLGNDDLDFSWRLRQAGYKLLVATDVFVHHEGQVSFRSELPIKTRLLVQESTNQLYGKLRDFYGENIPTPEELWGINWFAPYRFLTSLVILTRNNLEYTKMCLESIRKYTPEPHEIIVVDNGSTDGTVEYVKAQPDVRLIENGYNLGFALGNNRGLREARGEYIVFLNNDVVVTEGWLTRLLACAREDAKVGAVGPRSNYVAGLQLVPQVPYGEDMEAMQRFARNWSLENAGKWETVPRVIGFCMLVKREVIEKIGGFDPLFGTGNFEDDDFCLRLQLAGFTIKIAHDVFVHHFGSKTFQSEGIDYRTLMQANWELFKRKWGLPQDARMERGYIPTQLLKGTFLPEKHFVPLHFPAFSLEGLREKKYLAEFRPKVVRWFVERFTPEDPVTLVLYHPGENAFMEVKEFLEQAGYSEERVPDILIYLDRLSEAKIPELVAATDVVLLDGMDNAFLPWGIYLGKEIVFVP
ncbi:MAG: glycosyltransferase, partial [Candidatus Caldatribacteriaceae bacterium]